MVERMTRATRAALGMVKNRELGRQLNLALLAHLAVWGCLFAVFAAGLTYYVRSNEIAESVLEQATRDVDQMRERVSRISDERGIDLVSAAQLAWQELGSQPVQRDGRLVALALYNQDGRLLLERLDRGDADSEARNRVLHGNPPKTSRESYRYELVHIDGVLHIYAESPITNKEGNAAGRVRGLFLLSEAANQTLKRDTLYGVLLSGAIVLLTTIALYPVIYLLVRRLGRLADNLLHSNLEMLQVLGSAIAKRDADTDAHNYRVSLYSAHLAETLKLSRVELRRLLKGAFLHDLGKIGIPDRILLKPGPLEAAEMVVMRQHVSLGLDIIAQSHWLADAADVVRGHHEWFDGGGYPSGAAGDEIPLCARIFAIADVFDALCSERPYKKRFSCQASIEIMLKEAGKHFDPTLLAMFATLAADLHARYADCNVEVLREELQQVLSSAFSDKLRSFVDLRP